MMTNTMDRDFTTAPASAPSSPLAIYGEALADLGASDERIFCLSGDLTPATEAHLFRDRIPERFLNFGIAEANMIGAASGIARSGAIPLVHSFSVFLTRRCYDQVAMQLAYPKTNVKLVGFLPGLTTQLGVSHQAIDDLSLMRALPNMTIVEPADANELRAALKAAVDMPGPVYLRMRRTELEPLPVAARQEFRIGAGEVLRAGRDAVIFASGMMVSRALAAADRLKIRGIGTAVVNIHTLKPLDTEFVSGVIDGCPVVITAENHSIIGGLGSAICEVVAEAGHRAVVERVGIADVFAQGGSTGYLFGKYGLTTDAIVAAYDGAERRSLRW